MGVSNDFQLNESGGVEVRPRTKRCGYVPARLRADQTPRLAPLLLPRLFLKALAKLDGMNASRK